MKTIAELSFPPVDLCFKGDEAYVITKNNKIYRVTNSVEEINLAYDEKATSIFFVRDSLFVGTSSGRIYVYNENRELITYLNRHKKAVYQLCYDAEHNYLYSSSSDRTLIVWNLEEYSYVFTFSHQGPVLDMAILSAGTVVACAEYDTSVRLWTVTEQRGRPKKIDSAHGSFTETVAAISETRFVVATNRHVLLVYDTIATEPLCVVPTECKTTALAFLDGTLYCGNVHGEIVCYAVSERGELRKGRTISVSGIVIKLVVKREGAYVLCSKENRFGRWDRYNGANQLVFIAREPGTDS